MTDELLITLADIANVPPKTVKTIVENYEKATTGFHTVPVGYTVLEADGKRYAYKSLGTGEWSPMCASLDQMLLLRKYFISVGKLPDMDSHPGCWPESGFEKAWTSTPAGEPYTENCYILVGTNGRRCALAAEAKALEGAYARYSIIEL